jgi:hypothetical protein
MNTLKNKFWALLLITSAAFLSCKKDDQLSPLARTNNNTVTSTDQVPLGRNDWKIITYNVGDASEVKLFSDYAFRFQKRGIIQALTANSSEDGTWEFGKISKIVTITFKSSPLTNLNGDWTLVNQNDYEIKLSQVNREGRTVTLVFQRNQKIGTLPIQGEPETDPEVPIFE